MTNDDLLSVGENPANVAKPRRRKVTLLPPLRHSHDERKAAVLCGRPDGEVYRIAADGVRRVEEGPETDTVLVHLTYSEGGPILIVGKKAEFEEALEAARMHNAGVL